MTWVADFLSVGLGWSDASRWKWPSPSFATHQPESAVSAHTAVMQQGTAEKMIWFFRITHLWSQLNIYTKKTIKWSLYPLISPAAIDCVVGSWGPWSSCTSPCGIGSTERIRQVSVPPRNGGTPCPDLKQRRGCFGNNAICNTAKGETMTFYICPSVWHLLMHDWCSELY